MAITLRATGTAFGATSGSITSSTLTSANGDLWVAVAACAPGTGNLSVSDNGTGGTWSLVGTLQTHSSGAGQIGIFVRDNLFTGATTPTVTVARTSATVIRAQIFALQGVSNASSAAAVQTGGSSDNASPSTYVPTATFGNATSTNSFVIGGVVSSKAGWLPPTSWTEASDVGTGSVALEVASITTGFTSSTVTWGGANTGGATATVGVVTAEIGNDRSVALTGQSLTTAQGSLVASAQKALSGQQLASAQGSLVASVAAALIGQQLTMAQGTVTVTTTGGTFNIALTGQQLATAQGSLGVTASPALVGQQATLAQGALTPAAALALTGQQLVAATGTVSVAVSKGLTGQQLSTLQGNLVAAISKALSGQVLVASQGTLTAIVTTPDAPSRFFLVFG